MLNWYRAACSKISARLSISFPPMLRARTKRNSGLRGKWLSVTTHRLANAGSSPCSDWATRMSRRAVRFSSSNVTSKFFRTSRSPASNARMAAGLSNWFGSGGGASPTRLSSRHHRTYRTGSILRVRQNVYSLCHTGLPAFQQVGRTYATGPAVSSSS